MTDDELRAELVRLAEIGLADKSDIVVLIREMSAIVYRLPEYDEDDRFNTIIAVESEMDGMPTGALRDHYADALRRRYDDLLELMMDEQGKADLDEQFNDIIARYKKL